MIRECIISTVGTDGKAHFAPLEVKWRAEGPVVAPEYPSETLANLHRTSFAVINHTDDVRVFAGCLTGRGVWESVACSLVPVPRLAVSCLAHSELKVVRVEADAHRPRFVCTIVFEETHAPFLGFNRAQAAVIEGSILVRRLALLPADRIAQDMARLGAIVGKTAGPNEREAWGWLEEAVTGFRKKMTGTDVAGA